MSARKEIKVTSSDDEKAARPAEQDPQAEAAAAGDRSAERDDAAPKEDAEAVVEPVEEETGAAATAQEAPEEELSEEEKLRAQVADLEDRLLRSVADFDNFRKRSARQFTDIVQSANDRLLAEILDLVDNFERALAHTDTHDNGEALVEGMQLIYNQLRDLLSRHEVTPIEALGQPFDPNLHEAMMQVASDEYDEGLVALEIAKGYKIGPRILRHARVGVSTGPAVGDTNDAEKEA